MYRYTYRDLPMRGRVSVNALLHLCFAERTDTHAHDPIPAAAMLETEVAFT